MLPARTYALEAMLACLMVTCGLTLVWVGETFMLPHYGLLRDIVPEGVGGVFLAATGVVRLRAIILNGGYRYSPIMRIGGCCIGGGFWLSLAVSMGVAFVVDHALPPDVGLPLMLPVAITAFMFEILAVVKGSEDANSQDSFGLRQARSKAAGVFDEGIS